MLQELSSEKPKYTYSDELKKEYENEKKIQKREKRKKRITWKLLRDEII